MVKFLIKLWQKTRVVRHLLNFPQCRFYPSCSDYSIEAFKNYGLLKGFRLSTIRFIKCNPLSKGGIDLIPN